MVEVAIDGSAHQMKPIVRLVFYAENGFYVQTVVIARNAQNLCTGLDVERLPTAGAEL